MLIMREMLVSIDVCAVGSGRCQIIAYAVQPADHTRTHTNPRYVGPDTDHRLCVSTCPWRPGLPGAGKFYSQTVHLN